MIAENGEVLNPTRKSIDIKDWKNNPGVVRDFNVSCNCSYDPDSAMTTVQSTAWGYYVKNKLYIGLDIERYVEDAKVVADFNTKNPNLPLTSSVNYEDFMKSNNIDQRNAWIRYMTKYIYKPYIEGYREGIFESVPLSAKNCAGNSISINYADVINSTDTDFSIYDLRTWDYTEGKAVCTQITSPTTNNYYNTNNLYVDNILNWNTASGANNQALGNIRYGLQKAIPAGDRFSSPYISPTDYDVESWHNNFRIGAQPGQWLGMLKYTAVTGAEFFYPFYYLDGTGGKKASANNHIWQLTSPSYVQAITSRYIDIFRNGELMEGDYSIGDANNKTYTFNAHNPSILVGVRKWNNKYIISGNVGTLTNHTENAVDVNGNVYLERFSPLITDAEINLPLSNGSSLEDLKFKVRRQGSVYYYERNANGTNTLNTEAIFYQLDGWHEYSHPYYWSKDFVFQAELFDNENIPNGCGIKTVVGTTLNVNVDNNTTDFRKFKTYLTFGGSSFVADNGSNLSNASKLTYNFEPRSTDNNKIFTYSLNVSARKKANTDDGIIYAYLDNILVCTLTVDTTVWASYISFKVFSASANTNHTLTLGFSNADIEIDSLKLGQDIGICSGQDIILEDINMPILPNGSGYSYSWTRTNFQNQNPVFVIATPTHTISNASVSNSGLYTLTIRDGNGLIIYTHTISVVVSTLACSSPSCVAISDIEIEKSIYSIGSNTVKFAIVVKNHGCKAAENILLNDTWATGCFTYTGYTEQPGVSIYHQYEPSNPASALDIHIDNVAGDGQATIYLTYSFNYRCQDCDNCVSFVSFNGIEINPANNHSCVTVPNNLDTNLQSSYYVPSGGIQTIAANTAAFGGVTPYFTVVVPEYTTVMINGTVDMNNCEVIMMSGSKIIVPSGSQLNINQSRLHGCTEMWAGIEVAQNGTINLKETQISDAAYAVTLYHKAFASIKNSHLMKNYVGIFAQSIVTELKYGLDSYLVFSGNDTFSCPSVLLPPYQGQPISSYDMVGNQPNPYSRHFSYAGIEFHRAHYDFNLLPPTANLNFYSLNNGFMSYASDIRINGQFKFYNIRQHDPAYNDYDGSAIYVRGINGVGIFDYEGDGAYLVPDFIYCHHGLYAEAMTQTFFHDAHLSFTDVGVKLRRNQVVSIEKNQMRCKNHGVLMQFNANSHIGIGNNHIIINAGAAVSPLQYGTEKAGIASFDFDLPTDIWIAKDTIDMLEGKGGIMLVTAGRGFEIHNNLINLPHSSNLFGIGLMNTNQANMNCNEVAGDFGTGYATAISNDLDISCNIANETPTGFSFWGVCANTRFKGNYMQANPHFGLYLSPSALIGRQVNTGNLWLGTFPLALGSKHAMYDLPSGTPPTDTFYVLPYSGALLPNNRFPGGTDWFAPDLNNTSLYLCANSNAYCNGIDTTIEVPGNGAGSEFTNMDEKILEENLGAPQYTDEIQREAEAYLYEKVKENPILQQQNVDVEEFYADKSETNIGDFSAIKEGVNNLYVSPQDSLLNILQDSVKLLLAEIYVNDSLLATDTMNVDSIAIIAANQLLHSHIANIQSQIQSISQSIQTAKNTEADNLSVTNNLISTTRQMEDNEKVVNDIYLGTVSRGIYSLNPIQVSSLESIIYQCPLAGGSAVFKARSLYTLNTMQLWYNDDSLCNLVNMQWRHAQNPEKQTQGLNVYPNPTTGEVTFDFVRVLTEKQSLYIYNLQGQIVLQKEIEAELSKTTITFPNLARGVYLYRIEGSEANTGKIILE